VVYTIKIKPSAQKDLDSLPDKEVLNILNKINMLSENPRPVGTQKLSNLDSYRIRSGNYRVLYEVNDKSRSIFIFRIKHRKEAYK
jgi:mRNA interferase RelE/StbE